MYVDDGMSGMDWASGARWDEKAGLHARSLPQWKNGRCTRPVTTRTPTMKQVAITSGISTHNDEGLDLGDRRSHYRLVDRRGREIDQAVVETTPSSLRA